MTIATKAEPGDVLYRATNSPQLVTVPRLRFLSVDGHGDPNTSPAYADVVWALYAVAYAAKLAVKEVGGPDFEVSPLEGLWSAEDLSSFRTGDKPDWDWTLMIRQPDAVTSDLVERLVEEAATDQQMPAARGLRLKTFEEGPAAQVLHIGPYVAEGPTVTRLHQFIREQGFSFDGHVHKHHEIYLDDPGRTAPGKLRTIIRQPYAGGTR